MKNQGYSKGGGKPQDRGPKGKAFKHKHLGGKGLSLAAFANAKSKPAFNPSELRKQREYYKNAKNVKKYRKLVKRLDNEGHDNQLQIDTTTSEFDNNETEVEEKPNTIKQHPYISDVYDNGEAVPTNDRKVNRKDMSGCYQKHKSKNSHKSKSTLEKMREEYEKQQQEKERLRKEREAALEAKRAAQQKAEAKRKDMKSKMCRRTKSGQPIMKFRMEHLLDRIQNFNQ